jgi:hypothetical protein
LKTNKSPALVKAQRRNKIPIINSYSPLSDTLKKSKDFTKMNNIVRHGSIQGNNGEWSPKLEHRGQVAKAKVLDSSPACNPISPFFEPCLL